MDSFTQVVLGAAVGEKFLGKKLGNKALLYGGVIGSIPDLDVLYGKFLDPISALTIHRGFSHSILFFVLLSFPLALMLQKLESRKSLSYLQLYAFCFMALLTHALLDAFTTWGTQLFYPHPWRVALHSIFVIDPLYTLPFAFCLLMGMRRSKTDPKRSWWTNLGIGLSSVYLLITLGVQQLARDKFQQALQGQSISYQEIIVKPSAFNIVLWNAVIKTPKGYYLSDYSFLDTKSIRFTYYPNHQQWLEPFAHESVIRQLVDLSEGWYCLTKDDQALYFNDIRFGVMPLDGENQFAFSYAITNSNGVIQATEVKNKSAESGKQLLGYLITRIQGN